MQSVLSLELEGRHRFSPKSDAMKMERVGSRCDFKIYEGEKHGFFNYKNRNNYNKTILETDNFLQSFGYLKVEGISPKHLK